MRSPSSFLAGVALSLGLTSAVPFRGEERPPREPKASPEVRRRRRATKEARRRNRGR